MKQPISFIMPICKISDFFHIDWSDESYYVHSWDSLDDRTFPYPLASDHPEPELKPANKYFKGLKEVIQHPLFSINKFLDNRPKYSDIAHTQPKEIKFSLSLAKSTLTAAGRGVYLHGVAPIGSVVAFYPGKFILLSCCSQFIWFCCTHLPCLCSALLCFALLSQCGHTFMSGLVVPSEHFNLALQSFLGANPQQGQSMVFDDIGNRFSPLLADWYPHALRMCFDFQGSTYKIGLTDGTIIDGG